MSSKEENFKLFCELRGQEVEYRVNTICSAWKKGTLSEWYDNQVYCFGFQETDLLTDEIRSIKKPEYKPWTAETIPFPLAVRKKSWSKDECTFALRIYVSQVAVYAEGHVSYQELLDDWETREGGVCGVLKDD